MNAGNFLFTSESVSEGHPDKLCDRMSDEVVDLYLGMDPNARVACETLATTGRIVLAGEVRGPSTITPEMVAELVRGAVKDIGYEQPGFDWRTLVIENHLHRQSDDIAQGVDKDGAGDQGLMFGYACRETPQLMPAPLHYANEILRSISQARKLGNEPLLGPDGKSQLTIRYADGKPVGVSQIVVSHQHVDSTLSSDDVRAIVEPYVYKALPKGWVDQNTVWHVNPTGKFHIGGPDGDAGLTGRKIVVDTYGGAAPHGGGAFSGKDPTKVDRSAAYAARYLAKNVVAAGLADRCLIQLAYAIGVARPLALYVKADGDVDNARLGRVLDELVDLSPAGIRKRFKLNRPIYARTAAYGHFGRQPDPDGGFSWEATDITDELRRAF